MENLFPICQGLGLTPTTVMEFGAAHVHTSQMRDFVAAGVKTILVEANPRLFYCLKEGWDTGNFATTWPAVSPKPHTFPGFGHLPHVTLHHGAIAAKKGLVRFYEANASSFVEGVDSPAKANDHYMEANNQGNVYTIPSITTDMVDPGNVDVLAADVEGSEWFVLLNLVSRPQLICLETHGGGYVNPSLSEITGWMRENGYVSLKVTETDTIWIKAPL